MTASKPVIIPPNLRDISCSCGSQNKVRPVHLKRGRGIHAKGYHPEKRYLCHECRVSTWGQWINAADRPTQASRKKRM